MKLTSAVRPGLVAAMVLLTGCSQADEAQPTAAPSVTATTASSAASESSTDGSTSPDVPSSSADPTTTEPSTDVPSTDVPTAAPTTEAAPSVVEPTVAPSPVPVPSSSAEAPGTFPDPSEVEAGGAATNPLCEVLSTDEVATLFGAPVSPATDAAAGSGCRWSGTPADSTFVQLEMVGDPAQYVQPAGAETISGIGDVAFVVRDAAGWTAKAQNPDGTFVVQFAGPTAGRDGAVEGLRRLLERY